MPLTPPLLFLQVEVLNDEGCQILCTVDLTKKQSAHFIERIEEDYTVHMYVERSVCMAYPFSGIVYSFFPVLRDL